MRFVPLDEVEQPSSNDRELTFIPLETSEVEQDVSRPMATKESEGGVGKLLSDSFSAGLDGVEDMAPAPISRLVKAVRGKAIRSRNGSVLETEQLDPRDDYNEAELNRLSQRSYAESKDPTNPRNSAPSMKEVTAPLVTASQDGIAGRAADLVGAQFRGTAAGAMRAGADVASVFGDNPVSETLRQAGIGTSQIANEKQQRVSLRADQEGFVGEYLPQVLAQLPQVGIALLSGGITLPSVFSGMSAYAEARERGIDPMKATEFAIGMGTAEAIGEKLGGTGKLVDAFENAFKAGFTKNAVAQVGQAAIRNGLMELPSEQVTNALQFGLEAGYGVNPNPTPEQFLERAKDTAIISVGAGGMVGGAGGIATVAARPKSPQEEVARALAGELSGRDFDASTAGQAADLIFGTRSVDGSGVNRVGATLVEAERAKLNAMRTKASKDLGAAPDVDSAIAAVEKMVSVPVTGPVEEFVSTPSLPNVVPTADSSTLESFVQQTLQNAPAQTAADAAPLVQTDTGAAAAVRATDAGVGGALSQPAGVSVADATVQQGQSDSADAVGRPVYSLDPRLVPVSQRAPDSVNFAPSLRVVAEDNGRSTVQLVQTPERAQDDQQAVEQLRIAVNRYNPGDGDGIRPFRDFNLPSSARGRLDSLLGQFQRIAFVAEQALGVRLRYTQSLNDYGVAYKGNVFIDIPTVLKGDGKNQATGIFLFTAGHEGFHHFETSKNPADQRVAANFKAVLRSYIKDGAVDARQTFETDVNIKAGGKAVTRAYAESEVMADINGAMFIDPEFWGRLYQIDNGSTFRKVLYRMMQSLTKMINAAKKSRLDVFDLVKDVAAVREAAAQAWAQRANNQTPPAEIADEVVQYSRGVVAEVAPNPDQEVAADWKEMTTPEREQATKAVANKTVQRVADMLGLRGLSFTFSSGKYESDVNPNILIEAPDGVSVEQLDEFARALGYVLDQKAMVAFDEGNTTSDAQAGFVKVVLPRQMSTAQVDSLRKFIAEKVPQADGDTLRDGALVFGNFSAYNDKVETLEDEQYMQAIAQAVREFEWNGDEILVSQPERYHSALIWPDNRDGYLKGTRYGEGENLQDGTGRDDVRRGSGRDVAQLREVAKEAIALRDRWIGARAAARGRSAGDSQAANGAREAGKPEREYGAARDGAVSAVGVHFSQERRSRITSNSFGKGLKGLERERLTDPANSDIKPRINFYVSNGRGVIPEAGVGGITHTVKLNNLYPVKADPLKLVKNMKGANSAERASFFERSVMQAGFDGYLDNNTGGSQDFAVLIGKHDIDMPRFSRDFVESPDDINDLGAFNIDTFDFDAKTDEVIDGDSMADIANEVSEMGFGVKGAVASSPTDWKKVPDKALKGITPEAAFPMPDFAENEYGNLTAPVYAGGTQVRLELQPYGLKDEDLWTAALGGLRIDAPWGTPLSMRGAGRAEAAGYVQRMAAAKELNYRKFDFYKAVPAAAAKRIGEFWSSVPDIPGATEFAAGTPEVDGNSVNKLRQIVKARLLGNKDLKVEVSSSADFFFMEFQNTKTGEVSDASIQIVGKPRDVGQQSVVLHAASLNKGSGVGKVFYNIANSWANVVGVKVLADPDGLTPVNSVRRTENALSAAARTGGEALIEPGWAQRVYGFDGKAKTAADKRKNLTRIAMAQARNVYELAPDFEGVRYDMDTETFVSEEGTNADAQVKTIMSRPDIRRFSLGRTSFIRAALTRELIDNEVQLPETFGSPIMYSRSDPQTETPEFKKWFGNSKAVERVNSETGALVTASNEPYRVAPQLMYHTTRNDFSEFEFGRITKNSGTFGEWETSRSAVFVTPELDASQAYGKSDGKFAGGANVMPLFIKAENPLDLTKGYLPEYGADRFRVEEAGLSPRYLDRFDWSKFDDAEGKEMVEALKRAGYDSVIFNDENPDTGESFEAWAVFEPNQIKSAIGNSGDFDPDNADIRFSRRQLDSYMEGRNKTMPAISGAAAQEADIALAVKAIEAARTEIDRGKRDSLPIPIGRTPHVLNMLGARQKMLRIDTSILRKVLFDKHSEDFADVTPERFVRSIYMPAMVLRGRSVNEYEIVTSIVTPRGPIMVPVTDAGNSFAVMSAYAKNVGGGGESLVNRIKGGALLYADPAMAQVALTGRESAPVRGIITSGAQFPSAPPQSAQDSNVSQTDISVKPLNPYYVGWDRVRGDIIGGISSRKVKTDVDLMRRIGNMFKGDWEDAPSFSRAQPRQGQTFALPGEAFLSQQRRLFQDYFLPVLEVQRAIVSQGGSITEQSDVYRAEERMYGRVEETLRDFRKREFDPLIQEAIDNNITMDELSLYAYAKHAKERNAYIQTLRRDMPDTGSGLSNDEADDILTMFQVNGQTAVMERLHQRLMAITAATRREMLESELITQDEHDQMESQYENYVPLRGFEEVDQDGERTSVQRGGRGFNIRGKETTRALGRRTRAGNIIENIVLDYERAVFRGERNMVGQAFLELIRTNPDPKLWEIDAERTRTSFNRQTGRVNKSREIDSGPNTVAIKIKGREVYVKVYDERLLRALRKASKDETGAIEQFINSTVGPFTQILRSTLTQYNPVFAAVNAVRDFQSGGVAVLDELGAEGVALYTKHYRAALAASGRHITDSLGKTGKFFGDPVMDRYFEEYRAAGGTTGGYYGKSAEDVQQEIRNVLLAAGASPKTAWEKIKTGGGTAGGRAIMRGVQSTGKVLEFLGAASENAARVAAYRAAREMGKSPAEAASIAKNLTTNFNRKGEWGQALNGAFLFFNAAVQGSHRTLKALKRGRVWGLMAGLTATGIASVMLAMSVGGDDEDDGQPYWDKIPTFEKERNFIIMLPPGTDVDGVSQVGSNGRYIKIPMPYGFNVFTVFGVQLADVIRNVKDETHGTTLAQGGVNMLNAVMGSFNPFGGAISLENDKMASSVLQAVMPTVGDIIVQQTLGVDGFSRKTSPYKGEFDNDPDSENVNANQSGGAWHMIARMLNAGTGGSQAEPGLIDVSPGAIQNLWKNLTGGTGTFLSDVFVNLPTKMLQEEAEVTARDVPLLRNFYGQVDGMNDQSLLYERRSEIQRAKAYAKNREDLDMEPSDDPMQTALVSLSTLANKYTKEMSKLRREEIDIADDDEMSTAEKNIRKRELKLERNALAQEFNAAYMDAMRAKRDGDFDK